MIRRLLCIGRMCLFCLWIQIICAAYASEARAAGEELSGPTEKWYGSCTVQWENPSKAKPWLKEVKIVPGCTNDIELVRLDASHGLPNGCKVRITKAKTPLTGAEDGCGTLTRDTGQFRILLADGYGCSLSMELIHREGFVWLKDIGVFACADGDFASKSDEIEAMQAKVREAAKEPFRSTSEKYYAQTGFDETTAGIDKPAFRFAYASARPAPLRGGARPLAPRVIPTVASMPEVNYEYFFDRIEDPKHRVMFIGWPNVAQEFSVESNGTIGTSSNAASRTGHEPAESFCVQFGTGSEPIFKAHGDPSVRQHLEDGYHIIVHTMWQALDQDYQLTTLTYPLAGEEVRTGNEALAGFVRFAAAPGSKEPLWLKITPQQRIRFFSTGVKKPLKNLDKATIDGNMLMAANRVVLAFDGADAEVTSATDGQVLVKLSPTAERVDMVIPYIAVDKNLVKRAVKLGFDATLLRTKRYWDTRLAQGAVIDVPDPVVTNLYKTFYPRVLVCGDLDVEGNYTLKTSPLLYDTVWLTHTALGLEALARSGHFTEAKQYLDAAFNWQGSQASESNDFTTWEGFFNAPPRYTVPLWLNYHGWMQWAAARYFLFSDDNAYYQEKLGALIKSLEWTASQRCLTMKMNRDGSLPLNYGWLPGGRVTDGSTGTSTFSDCINWMGFDELTRLLERKGHPRAAEFRIEADAYRQDLLRGIRLACSYRPPCRLNDATYVPYVPGYLESTGREENMWYAAVVDAALEGILHSGIGSSDDNLENWIVNNLEDNLFVVAPGLADEAYYCGHILQYIRRDRPVNAIYGFYSLIASHMSRQTLTTIEHRSWGAGRVWDLTPWAMGPYYRILANVLCYDEGDDLMYGRATPKAWLDPGKHIRVQNLQTRFGPTSFTLTASDNRITGVFDLPVRYRPGEVRLRLRVNGSIKWVRLNGKAVTLDRLTNTITLPSDARRVELNAAVTRLR